MMRKVVNLVGAAVNVASVPLVFGLKKSAAVNPEFHQFLVRTGQRINFGPPFDNEEKAIELVAEGLTVLTMVGTGIYYHRKKRWEQRKEELRSVVKQILEDDKKRILEEKRKKLQLVPLQYQKPYVAERVQAEAANKKNNE